MMQVFDWVHHTTGLPWWGTIMVSTLAVHLLIFPIMGRVMKNNARLQALKVSSLLLPPSYL
jgi:membrane protein insertase Oxa1/YidC/SpoIIIJ